MRKVAIVGLVVLAPVVMGQDSCSESLEEADKASEQLEKLTEPNKQIDKAVQSVPLGSSIGEVRAKLGPPDDSQVSRSQYAGETTTLQFLYYGQWQLSFTDGVLDGKSQF